MTDIPDKVLISTHDLEKLLSACEECAIDLKTEIGNNYTGTLDYPSQERRYKRDVESAEESILIISKFRDRYNIVKSNVDQQNVIDGSTDSE